MRREQAHSPTSTANGIDSLCDGFEAAVQRGEKPRLEDWLARGEPPQRGRLLAELLGVELEYRRKAGQRPTPEEYVARFPEFSEAIDAAFAREEVRQEDVRRKGDDRDDSLTATGEWSGEETTTEPAATLPGSIGRYGIERLLGRGGFGRVYLAYDEQLERRVAIKTPHPGRVAGPADAKPYLAEARTVAGLDHPHIVPVYDVGGAEEFPLYVVSKYIDGQPLSERLKQGRPSFRETAERIACVAEALSYAHKQGLVHRDVKPANILLDAEGKPLLTDFGLALSEAEQPRRRDEISGSPAYMAPEQAQGRSHHLDGRTDIWALGVTLYEMLAGRRPFEGRTRTELFEEICQREPKPPRMIDETIPEPLERIALKCLAKPVADRYATAGDLARDLRQWLAAETDRDSSGAAARLAPSPARIRWPRVAAAAVGSSLLMLLWTLVLWLDNRESSQPASVVAEGASSPPPAALAGDLNVLVWRDEQFLPIEDRRARPVRTGDLVRVEAKLNCPAHVYLAWIDSAGRAEPFYPGEPEDWSGWRSPPERAQLVSFPPGADSAFPIEGGPGMEAVVMLATDQPLSEDLSPGELFADLPPQPLRQFSTLLYLDNGQRSDRPRRGGDWGAIQSVGDPALEIQRKLQRRFADHVSLIQAVIFAHSEDR